MAMIDRRMFALADPRLGRDEVELPPGGVAFSPFRRVVRGRGPASVPVAGVAREIRVKIASDRDEWRQAFALVSANYQARGYEGAKAGEVRFTPHHALPEAVTFVAKHGAKVLATFSMVPDNTKLGLPLESIYGDEIGALRRSRRRLAEVTSLAADRALGLREFRPVFIALIKLMMQHHVSQGGDTWVITVNPRHRDFYSKGMGGIPLGPPRAYASVENHPAEGYYLDLGLMEAAAPGMYREVFGQWHPGEALAAPRMLPHLVRYLGDRSTHDAGRTLRHTLAAEGQLAGARRW